MLKRTVTVTAARTSDGLSVNLSGSSSAVGVPSTITVPANSSSGELTANVFAVRTA